jgi:hypothetical protein
MKKGISFERIVLIFFIILILIFIIKSLDPGFDNTFVKEKYIKKNPHFDELAENSFNAKPINITIFIDPSSRIDAKENGERFNIKRDTMIIRTFISDFLIRTYGTNFQKLKANGNHFQILTHPDDCLPSNSIQNFSKSIFTFNQDPNNASIWNRIVNQKYSVEPREYTLDSLYRYLIEHPTLNLTNFYDSLDIRGKDVSGKRKGSDIYHFLQSDLKANNVTRNGCRNILVFLTDGWFDYRYSRIEDGSNEITFIKDDKTLKDKLIKYGDNLKFKVPCDLKNDGLEIYVFGLSKAEKVDENFDLTKLWQKWLKEMVGDKNFRVFNYQGGGSYESDIFYILNPKNEGH